jgi:Ala-tRNA(Pro) deacylase
VKDREKIVYKVFEELGIKYEKRIHPPVYTCEESGKYTSDLRGSHCKNLFLRNKKGNNHCKNLFFRNKEGNNHYLVVVEENKTLNIKDFEKRINEKKLSFASEKRMMKYLGLAPGSVSIFGLINDKEKKVIVYLDEDVFTKGYINFHPNVNTATLNISTDDFKKYLKWCRNLTNKYQLSINNRTDYRSKYY